MPAAAANKSFPLLLIGALVFQNSISALLGRSTRSHASPDELYSINHFVVASECLKFLLSLLFELYSKGSIRSLCKSIHTHTINSPLEAIKSAVPAALYLISNTLQYVALSNLSAPVFQVLYQAKLVTTALTSVLVFQRKYSLQQWICIVGVSLGVAIVVIGEEQGTKGQRPRNINIGNINAAAGVSAIAMASLMSALSGVYFEKILKQEKISANTPEPPSLWMRNVVLSFFSILIGLLQGITENQNQDSHKLYFHGFTTLVWIQVCFLAIGGLIVASVIKHADNVIKGLATGLSVALSTAASSVLFGTPLTAEFGVGTFIILTSVYCFNNPIPVGLSCGRQKNKLLKSVGTLIFVLSSLPIFYFDFPLPTSEDRGNLAFNRSYQNPYKKTVDVLSFGSKSRPEYQTAQAQTWGSHASIRNFFGVDESHDHDQDCSVHLSSEDVYNISQICRTKNFGLKHGRPEDSALKAYERNMFARKQFLEKKSNPAGWLCCMPRPTLGLASLFDYYRGRNEMGGLVFDFPDYLIITDDDTYYNMEIFQRELGDKSTEIEPEGYAGCLVRYPFHMIKFTFPHGGFGLILSKAALRNLVEPIFCDENSMDPIMYYQRSPFVKAACNRLQQPLYDEAQLFRDGMRLIDLMVQYVTFQPYSKYRDWETGFCQHGDWLWGYFFSFYNVTNHVVDGDEKLRDVGENRLHAYLGSQIYSKGTVNCLNENEKCDENSGVCHYQSPTLMEAVTEKIFNSMNGTALNKAFRWRDRKAIQVNQLSPFTVTPPEEYK